MKKYIWLVGLLLVILIIPALTACGGAPAPTPTPTPTPTRTPTPTATPTPTPTPTTTQITAIPHTLEGRADCLMCHKTGIGGATVIPADHSTRTNETCQTCHKPAK